MLQKEYRFLQLTRLAELYYGDKYDYTNKKGREAARNNFNNSKLDKEKLEKAQRAYVDELQAEFDKMNQKLE